MTVVELFQAASSALLADYAAKDTIIATLTAQNSALTLDNDNLKARVAALTDLIDQLATLVHAPLS